jgi:hypothetical protein
MLSSFVNHNSGMNVVGVNNLSHKKHIDLLYGNPFADIKYSKRFATDSYLSIYYVDETEIQMVCYDNHFTSDFMGEFQNYLQNVCKYNQYELHNHTEFTFAKQHQIVQFQTNNLTQYFRKNEIITKNDLKIKEMGIVYFHVSINVHDNQAYLIYICDKIICCDEFDDNNIIWTL